MSDTDKTNVDSASTNENAGDTVTAYGYTYI